MSVNSDIRIIIEGPEHHGKTKLTVLLERWLQNAGMKVITQHGSQIDKHMLLASDQIVDDLQGTTIFVMEMNTTR